MHDLHEANKILNLILEYAAKNRLNKVSKAVIDLGRIIEHGDEINPENLAFNIKMLAKNTKAEEIEVEITRKDGAGWILKTIEGE